MPPNLGLIKCSMTDQDFIILSDPNIKVRDVPAFPSTKCRVLIRASHLPWVMCNRPAYRSLTLETVKVEGCTFMHGMWDVAMTKLPKLQRCWDKDSSSWSLEKKACGKEVLLVSIPECLGEILHTMFYGVCIDRFILCRYYQFSRSASWCNRSSCTRAITTSPYFCGNVLEKETMNI